MYDNVRIRLNGRHVLNLILVYLIYMFVQGQKTAFGFTQSRLIASNNFSGLNSYFLVWINFAYYLVWGLSYIFAGPLSDVVSPKLFCIIGSWGLSATYVLLALVATYSVSNAYTMMTVAIFVAIPGPWPWPCVLSIINQWFHRDYLVLVLGIFISCINLGPTLANVVGKITLSTLNQPMMTPVYVYACCLALTGIFFLYFIQWSPNGVFNKNIDNDNSSIEDQKKQKRIDYITVWSIPNFPTYLISYVLIKCGQAAYISFLTTYYLAMNVSTSSNISILTDMGAFGGGILVSLLCYRLSKKPSVILVFLWIGSVLLAVIYAQPVISTGFSPYMFLAFLVSFFYGGAYNMMTSIIPVSLSNQEYLKGIFIVKLDYKYCTGTVVSNYNGWGNIAQAANAIIIYYSNLGGGLFFYVILLSLLSGLFLLKMVVKEYVQEAHKAKVEPMEVNQTENDIINA